ncbi:hypothetical protein JHK84_053137 [Glycine max]|nr:hypothetical protein JHK84_053137 [Glycine max]
MLHIVCLVFRPQSPHFDVFSVTLNAAYLDLGYLLNADLTMLANFTNPNKKVHVDFSSVIIYLYYGSTLIATQYVETFNAARLQSRVLLLRVLAAYAPAYAPSKDSRQNEGFNRRTKETYDNIDDNTEMEVNEPEIDTTTQITFLEKESGQRKRG